MSTKYPVHDVREHHGNLFRAAKNWLEHPTIWDPGWTDDWTAVADFLNRHPDGRMFHESPWTPKGVMGLFSQYRFDDRGNVVPTPRAPRQSLGFRRAATGYRRYLKTGTQQYRKIMASVVQAVMMAGGSCKKAATILESSGSSHLRNYRQGRPWTALVVSGLFYRLKRGNEALYSQLVNEIPMGTVAPVGKVQEPKVLRVQELLTAPAQDFDFYAPPTAKPESSKPKGRVMKIQIREAGDLLQVFRTKSGTLVLTVKSADQPGGLMAAVDQFCQGLGVTIPKVL